MGVKYLSLVLLCLSLKTCLCEREDADIERLKYVEKLVKGLHGPIHHLGSLQAALCDPVGVGKVFDVFEAEDFVDDVEDWDRDEAMERFKEVMTSVGGEAEKLAYLEIILDRLDIQISVEELEETGALSESFQFQVDVYQRAVRSVEESSHLIEDLIQTAENYEWLVEEQAKFVENLTLACEGGEEFIAGLLDGTAKLDTFNSGNFGPRAIEQFTKYQELGERVHDAVKTGKMEDSISNSTQDMNKLVEMCNLWTKHTFRANLRVGFKHVKEGVPVKLEVLEKLVEFHAKIEGLKNLVLLETDATMMEELGDELSEEEELLADFMSEENTIEQILNVVPGTGVFLRKAGENVDAISTIRKAISQKREVESILTDQYKELYGRWMGNIKRITEILENVVKKKVKTEL